MIRTISPNKIIRGVLKMKNELMVFEGHEVEVFEF